MQEEGSHRDHHGARPLELLIKGVCYGHWSAFAPDPGPHPRDVVIAAQSKQGGRAMRLNIGERCTIAAFCVLAAAWLVSGSAQAQQQQFPTAEVPTSEAAYLAKVKTAAPEPIVKKATIVMMRDGKPRELQAGTNGFTCMIGGDGSLLCADPNGMEWIKSIGARTDPPDKIGFIYMLAGDTGTTNHHPHQ